MANVPEKSRRNPVNLIVQFVKYFFLADQLDSFTFHREMLISVVAGRHLHTVLSVMYTVYIVYEQSTSESSSYDNSDI